MHVAYVWPFRLKLKKLSFAALTLGALAPDLENPILYLMGFYPWRLATHSFLGTFTVDLLIVVALGKFLSRLRVERFGLNGFMSLRIDSWFLFSAFLGSLSHILIDWMHHSYNPLFWPFEPFYVAGLLLSTLSRPFSDLLINLVSALILIFTLKSILNRQGQGLLLIFRQPFKALSLITDSLSRC